MAEPFVMTPDHPAPTAEDLWRAYNAAYEALEVAQEDFDAKRAALAPFGLCDLAHGLPAKLDDGSPLDPEEARAVADAVAAHAIRQELYHAAEKAGMALDAAINARSVATFAASFGNAITQFWPGGVYKPLFNNSDRYPVAELAETLGKLLYLDLPDDQKRFPLTPQDRDNIIAMRNSPGLIVGMR